MGFLLNDNIKDMSVFCLTFNGFSIDKKNLESFKEPALKSSAFLRLFVSRMVFFKSVEGGPCLLNS